MTTPDLAAARQAMVRDQLQRRGLSDQRVLRAMAEVCRETFVPSHLAAHAYDDAALPIDGGQTISQPYMVAFMLEAATLSETDRVLEVGTGSGYAAALLGRIAARVHTIERDAALVDAARARLAGDGRIRVRHGDGSAGWPDAAPFDAILVAAASPRVPPALKDQLAVGGRLIVPIGDGGHQRLVKLTRMTGDTYEERDLAAVRFVPLVPGQTR